MTDMDLGKFCPEHTDQLVDALVDYCTNTYGSREGAIRALAAVGVGAQQCTVDLPHAAHLDDGCPGLSLTEWIAGEGEQPLRASTDPDSEPEGPDYDETTETADECRRDLLESEQ